MKTTLRTAMAALLTGAAFASVAANAQSSPAAQAAENPNAIKTHTPKLSRQAVRAVQELQKVINENNSAAIPASLAAAQAAAKTADDRYAIGILQLRAAAMAKDNAGIAAAIEAMLGSGSVAEDEKYSLYINLAQTYSALKVTDRAAQAYQQALQLNPNSVEATAGVAETKIAQGKPAEALSLLQKGIALQSAGGARPSEGWFKRAVAIAYKARMPQAMQVSRDWVKAYPTGKNWSDALAIYQNLGQLDETRMLDLLRLKRAAGTLTGGDYFNYADIAVRKALSGEAKAVLEEGFAANAVNRSDPSFSQLYNLASQRTKGDRESLPAVPVASASARQTVNIGDAYFGYNDYAKAAEFYRAALAKPDADANLINLRIGMALARQGDTAGATAALNAAGGEQAELAKYWLVYAATRA